MPGTVSDFDTVTETDTVLTLDPLPCHRQTRQPKRQLMQRQWWAMSKIKADLGCVKLLQVFDLFKVHLKAHLDFEGGKKRKNTLSWRRRRKFLMTCLTY